MTKKDGEEVKAIIEDFVNTEINAGNRLTKYSGTMIGNLIMSKLAVIIEQDEKELEINKQKEGMDG